MASPAHPSKIVKAKKESVVARKKRVYRLKNGLVSLLHTPFELVQT
jgi:hypothetical protein